MRINHNIQALNAYRNLSVNQAGLSKHLEKLSSGLRINRAADDAAGLAISEKMRSQIRGLEMAERNTMDAISLIQTAEGSLSTTHEILQRMRELAVQASNGTLEDVDRAALQDEMDQLTQEIDRIAKTTQFNSKPLLRGDLNGRSFATVNSAEVTYQGTGTWGGDIFASPTSKGSVVLEFDDAFGSLTKADIAGKIFTINGQTYEIQADPATPIANGNIAVDVSAVWNDGAAGNDPAIVANIDSFTAALKNAIINNDPVFDNSNMPITQAGDNGTAADGDISNGRLVLRTTANMTPAEAQAIAISTDVPAGVQFLNETTSAPVTTLVADEESTAAKTFTLTMAEVPKDGDSIVIDGVTIQFGTADASYSTASKTATIDISGRNINEVLSEIITHLDAAATYGDTPDLNSHAAIGSTLILSTTKTDAGGTSGLQIAITDNDFTVLSGTDLSLSMQVGANADESMEITISVMDAASLGLAREADRTTPITTPGVDAAAGLDISSSGTAAQGAIDIIDQAIQKVSQQRSKLGAYQNRLEHTINNLGNAAENLTAAESRIRDADMAEEMTNFTKANIINQAATSMLAQANQLPQGILQLLQ